MSDVYEAADAGSVTLLGLLDLSAAFDTVDHRILLDRLAHDYGIRGRVIQWIKSYLTGRSQVVRYNGVTSKTVPVTSGVPQGSVLGPILFISYSAAVVAIVQHQGFKVHAFADDLQIYGSTAQNGAADLMARMSICIECVTSWMSSNRLRLNPSKTELIWLGTSRRLQHCDGLNMTVCGADIRPVDCVRDLGVLIDSNMTLSNHVNNVAGICFYQLRQLRIIRRSLTTDAAHSLVRALIHTRIDYCNGLLAAGPKYMHEKLQSVLRAAARLVLQLPHRASVSGVMRGQLHWLEMPDRVRFKLCTLVYRCLHGLAPSYLSDLCTPATVHAHLRSSGTLERSLSIPRTKTKTLGPRGFYFASSAAWNALPVHLRDPTLSLNSFKIKLKTHFFSWPHLGYNNLLSFNLFVVRANAIFYKLARASVCIELNWIELNLGINLSENMQWTYHIDSIVKKANKKLGQLRRNAFKLNTKQKIDIYKSMIRPILEYGAVLFDNCSVNDSLKLDRSREKPTYPAQTLPMYFQYVFSRSTALVSWTCALVS